MCIYIYTYVSIYTYSIIYLYICYMKDHTLWEARHNYRLHAPTLHRDPTPFYTEPLPARSRGEQFVETARNYCVYVREMCQKISTSKKKKRLPSIEMKGRFIVSFCAHVVVAHWLQKQHVVATCVFKKCVEIVYIGLFLGVYRALLSEHRALLPAYIHIYI